VIVLDTSVLIESFGAGGSMRRQFRGVLDSGHRMVVPTLVLYEWLRGPRLAEELDAQEAVIPSDEALPFGAPEARIAASLYGEVRRPRGREIDLAIAACAIAWNGALWTLNVDDFSDVPRLRLHA
jgi:predicted nucleic acid-binding protein